MRAPPRACHRRHILVGGAVMATATLELPFGPASATRTRSREVAAAPQSLFATDIRLPGLLHAIVARPPLPGWRLAGIDPSPALRAKGVVGLVRLEPWGRTGLAALGGVAVIARDTWSALRGRDALLPHWREASTDAVRPRGHETNGVFRPETAEPLMEPPSATVLAEAERCTVWSCLADPEPVRTTLADLLGLQPSAVTLNPTVSAAAKGRFSDPAYAVEAARLSRAMDGAPVSLTWTREDDLPFRDGAVST